MIIIKKSFGTNWHVNEQLSYLLTCLLAAGRVERSSFMQYCLAPRIMFFKYRSWSTFLQSWKKVSLSLSFIWYVMLPKFSFGKIHWRVVKNFSNSRPNEIFLCKRIMLKKTQHKLDAFHFLFAHFAYNRFCPKMKSKQSMRMAGIQWKNKMMSLWVSSLLRMFPSGYQTAPSKGCSWKCFLPILITSPQERGQILPVVTLKTSISLRFLKQVATNFNQKCKNLPR